MEYRQKDFSLSPIINQNSRVLILGSMPGKESLAKKQYYANKRNQFWRIIFPILELDIPSDYQKRIAALSKHKIALWDVINVCERVGSLDSKIKNEEPNDILNLLKTYPSISFIAFNGNKAFDVFKKHIGLESLFEIEFKILPSTSPTPGKYVKSIEEKIKDWSIIKKYITF